jgi:quinohemoprotein ethanol dehydrogenase
MRRHANGRLALLLLLSLLVISGPTLIAAQQGTPVAETPTVGSTATTAAAASPTVAAATAAPGTAASVAANPAGQPAGAEWTTYGGNLFDQRYSSLDQITAGNVATLKGVWTFHTGIQSERTSFESSPIVKDGVMYLTGPQSQVFALDAATGKELWKYVPPLKDLNGLPLCCGQTNRGVAVGEGLVFVGQVDAKLTALDAKTGQVKWSVSVADARAGYSETVAPIYLDGLVYIGISGAEYEIRGMVTAYRASTGDQVWRFHTIPGPGEPGHDTWPAANDIWKVGGGSVWQVPAVDPVLGLMYIVVGNPSPDLDGSKRAGDNLFTESIVALDLKTGAYKWHFQEIHHDIWDYDVVSPPVLFDVDVNGATVKGIGEAGKTGWVYLLDRSNGKPITPINEQPVPQDKGQHTSATQPYPQGDAFVPQQCAEKVANFPMGPIFSTFGRDPVLICPGANGGAEWSPSSYSPQTGLMYVCGINQPQIWTTKPEKQDPGTLRLGSTFITPPGGKTSGTFTAVDVRTNKIAWQKQWDQMCVGGSLATAGGLVFAGEGNGNLDAYDAKTGDALWQFQTGAGANAPAVTYEINGAQYVAIASGGNFQLGFPRGDTLWVFALNGTMGPAKAPAPPSAEVAANAASTDHVAIVDFGFNPGVIIVPPGTTVTWTNTGEIEHTVTEAAADKKKPLFDSGLLKPGQSFSYTFDKPGTYDYYCEPHPFMRGIVVVDPNASAPAAAPVASPASSPAAASGSAIQLMSFAFAPASVDVAVGTAVTWTNNDSVTHTVTADDKSFDSGNLDPGKTFSFTFTKAGTYTYHCAIHPNMKATIVVK